MFRSPGLVNHYFEFRIEMLYQLKLTNEEFDADVPLLEAEGHFGHEAPQQNFETLEL